MEGPEVSGLDARPAVGQSGTEHGRTFPVHIDDREVLLHEQLPTGPLLLSQVGKPSCACRRVLTRLHTGLYRVIYVSLSTGNVSSSAATSSRSPATNCPPT